MEWYSVIALVVASLLFLMIMGLPVAFSFLVVNLVGAYVLLGGLAGVEQLVINTADSISSFTLVPIALFMIMGEGMFQSRIAIDLMDTLDKWFGKLRGRLAFMAVGGGVLFSTLTGNSMGSIALLGSTLVPEMEKRGYKKPMSLGPILGSAGLAIMIPPSSLAVVLGVVAELSIGKILIGIIVPGLLMAVIYTAYIYIRCTVEPDVAPSFDVEPVPMGEKLYATATNILPLTIVVFAVVGVIFMGIATPSEAAATGAVATLALAAAKRRLTWNVFSKAMFGSANISVMVLLIVSGAVAFSQLLAFTGATYGMVNAIVSTDIGPSSVVLLMITSVVILGMFMGPLPIMLITLPVFIPVVTQFGFNPIWFAAMYLVAIETGSTSPPLGGALFVMKAVAPSGTTMKDIYRAATPFILCDILAILILFFFPQLVIWPVETMFR
ncbi:TRAP transporter, DctM subunit [Aliiroseovarius crassostreae]|uniref:C4-dicarboxylate ABC transporter permease n=1 Tax=Aliiroseovarius crassostreae TaxID=154981 RepID=A0A0P7J630_9RHOB|nr:TRAP transporter large permease subunit [Aliiroseovarius crassostreae]KPN63613.1 C4-dicarboxylate ABC transporter permease [Aliiroseovarius crassostreae]SFU89943.1 TRAP transporter, DctM subunit [Aliiroseovarius crassostreae]